MIIKPGNMPIQKLYRNLSLRLVFITLFYLFLRDVNATEICTTTVAKVVSVQGIVELRRENNTAWEKAQMGIQICLGDQIRVRKHSRAAIRLMNESVLRLDQRTVITFPEAEENKIPTLMDLLRGAIHFITRTPRPFNIRTPYLNAATEGTEFFIGIDEETHSTRIVLYEGRISANNDYGSLTLDGQEAAIAPANHPPRKETMVRPIDAVQWALYYPAIIDHSRNNALQNRSDSDDQLSTAEYFLSIGRVDEANDLISQTLAIDAENSGAIALQSIIAVTQNNKELALELAIQAVTSNPLSAPARLALSYAQQAHFEIKEALLSVQHAVDLDSNNALLWARLAELYMSTGELRLALDAAQEAVELNSAIAKTQTVMGFAYLLKINTAEAKSIFAKAIQLDQADPMPRLGFGLVLIREGKLEAGRIELEIAASLDPGNSLIRSYLGKAYFEENRYPLANKQFGLAKMLDPLDPTPWLYDAIQKQTQNQPVEALKDIQKSIELNDNRAVYRSSLLLDQDEATRGTSLARIYDNLGFERRAIVETAKSLSIDPANHSAHRFLSDTYLKMPLHTAARVSELLQAQLMQPININPVQPPLAIDDFNILTETGVTTTGFNEFTPLMERNKSQFIASGIVGSNKTFGDEIVFSKLHDKTSVSLGQYHFQTGGFRRNNDQNHDIVNIFIQHSLTPKLNIQAEYRTRISKFGDVLQDFDEARTFFNERVQLKQDTIRTGMKYALSPSQNVIFSGRFVNAVDNINRGGLADEIFFSAGNKGLQVEAQHLYKKSFFNSVFGGGVYYFDINSNFFSETVNRKEERENIYFYSQVNPRKNLSLTLGLSYDNTRDFDKSKDKLNPKFGAQWNFTNNIRLRAAWFKVTKPFVFAQQTIEPTQVAGFNQFFDDVGNTRSRRSGIGLDYHFSQQLYAGAEISKRILQVPIQNDIFLTSAGFFLQKQKEHLYRGYLYWTPHPFWAIKGEFQFEKFARNPENVLSVADPIQIENINIPISMEYFHPSGFFSGLTGTFIRQDLKRLEDIITVVSVEDELNSDIIRSGVVDFFILDAAIGYRLPKRKGVLSLEGRNLLDKQFSYRNFNLQPINSTNLNFSPTRTFTPGRTVFVRLTLNF